MLEVVFSYDYLSSQSEELLIALLINSGFEGIWHDNKSIKAYTDKNNFNEQVIQKLIKTIDVPIKYSVVEIENRNWNSEWESKFEPVIIAEKILIRATFHSNLTKYPIEIIIQPQMSFGTGHHPTTYMLAEYLLKINLSDKVIMDVGCGTGILSIIAEKLGASKIYAFDIDEISVKNSKENASINNCSKILISQNTIQTHYLVEADIIIANVNRNVLLNEIPFYTNFLKKDGILLLSGFLKEDVQLLNEKAINNGLTFQHELEKNSWYGLVFKK